MTGGARLALVGSGYVARAAAALAGPRGRVVATTRAADRAEALRRAGIEPVVAPALGPETVARIAEGSDVLVSFPPDGATDAAAAPACRLARSVVYISSTGVYGGRRGRVDDATPADEADPRAGLRLAAEAAWREAGAVVLRAPGIYGPGRGLHVRLREGSYATPGDGSGVVSRIHVEDLARFVLAAFERGRPGDTFVVGDLAPVPQIEAVAWLCDRMGLPLPPSVPLERAHPTLRGSRAVDPSRAIGELGVTLRFPSYREGFAHLLDAPPARPA